jgi:hypothetical protein
LGFRKDPNTFPIVLSFEEEVLGVDALEKVYLLDAAEAN